jgi:hypothetical protein
MLLVVAMLATCLLSAVGKTGEVRRSAGRVSLTIDAAVPPGGGFGATRHKGTLTLTDGTTHLFTVQSSPQQILVANSCTLPPEAIRRYHMAHGAYAWLTGRDALCWQGGSLEEGCTVSAGVPPGPIVR